MVESFLFVFFTIFCLIAQASCGRLDEQNNQLELSEDRDIRYRPFLSCVLLKDNSACNETCFLIGSIYRQPITSGFCGDYYECVCNILPNASLADYWNQNFDSDNLLEVIRRDRTLSNKILAVLKEPFRTPQETISDLKPLLNAKQLNGLRFKDNDSKKLFVADGTSKFEAVKNYVFIKLKSLEKSFDGRTVVETLKNALRSPGILYDRIRYEIRRSRNELLNEALDESSRSRNISTPSYNSKDDEDSLIRLLDAAVVNKLIISPPRDSSTEPNRPELTNTSPCLRMSKVWWKLPGFKKTEVGKLRQRRKVWKVEGSYYVSMHKTRSGLRLDWRNVKHNVDIKVDIGHDDKIHQEWNFPNGHVELHQNMDGTKTQKWMFKNCTCELNVDSQGVIQGEVWVGEANKDLIEKYKQGMNTWCAENDYMIGKDNCIIY